MTHGFNLTDSGKGMKICVICSPVGEFGGGDVLLYDLIKMLEPLANEMCIITGNLPEDMVANPGVHITNVKHDSKKQPMAIRTFKFALLQFRVCFNLIKIRKRADIVLFYIGGASDLLPALSAKLLRKKIVIIVVGSPSKSAKETYSKTLYGYGGVIFYHIINALEKINYRLANQIITESRSITHYFELEKHEHKISLSGCFFNTAIFELEKDFADRRNMIGYIGRLSEEKGIMNFVRAIPLILNMRADVEFLIGGDGKLLEKIRDELRNAKLSEKVALIGLIQHEELIHYYNDLKLLIVPSYTESIPIVALEAMACGTPVLATPVGGVPDVISDEGNGFILKDNSPQCIAESVVKALEHPRLGEIAQAAYASVESEFTYQAATEKYRMILNSLI